MRFDKSILHLPWYKLYLSYLQRATTKKVVARGAFGFGLDLLLAVTLWFGIASMKRVRYVKGVISTPNSTLDTPAETLKIQTMQDAADSLKR